MQLPRTAARTVILVASFALLMQPLYAIATSHIAKADTVGNDASTTDTSNQQELEDAINDTGIKTINIGASFSVTKQITISRPLTINNSADDHGVYHVISGEFTGTSSNSAVLAIKNTTSVIINHLIVDRGTGVDLSGIDVNEATATLNNVTARNFNATGTRFGLIVGPNAQVTAANITTNNNGIGVNINGGTAHLTISGQSAHSESVALSVDDQDSSRVTDINNQYSYFDGAYTLASTLGAPTIPIITTPIETTSVTESNTTINWNIVAGSTTTQMAAHYEYQLDGGAIVSTAEPVAPLTGLSNGQHTIAIRAISAWGLASDWNMVTFSVALSIPENNDTDNTPNSPVDPVISPSDKLASLSQLSIAPISASIVPLLTRPAVIPSYITPAPAADNATDFIANNNDSTDRNLPSKVIQSSQDRTKDSTSTTPASASNNRGWSIANLILTGLIIILSVMALIGFMKKDDEKHIAARITTLVIAVGAIIALSLTEEPSSSMTWFNWWTLLYGVLFVVQMIVKPSSEPEIL